MAIEQSHSKATAFHCCAMARNVTVDKVLRSVASNSQQGGLGLQQNRNKRQSPPRYSPKSIVDFDVNFDAHF